MRFHFAVSIFLLFAVICYQVSSAVLPTPDYHADTEAAINKEINEELHASYVYHSLADHFEDHNVAQHGFAKFFKKYAQKKVHSAEELSHYQNLRGGHITYPAIEAVTNVWGTALESFVFALELEKSVNKDFYALHELARTHGDSHLSSFLAHFVTEQFDTINELHGIIANLKSVGPGLGEFVINKRLGKQQEEEHD